MSQYGFYCYHSWHQVLYVSLEYCTSQYRFSVLILLQLSGLALEYCMSQYGFYCYHSCQVWHWSIVCLGMDYIAIIAVRSGTGVLYVSVWIILLSQMSGLALEYCTSQYDYIFIIAVRSGTGVLCVYMDSIVIAVRFGTGVLYVSVWILLLQLSGLALEYCMSQYGFYCYHSCQVWHWSIVRLSMDSIFIIAVRSGTGVLYVSVWILLLQLSGLALEYCMSQYGFYCYSYQVWHWSIVCLSMDSIVIIAVRSGTGVLYVSVWILFLSQLSGLALEYCMSQYGYCYSCQVWHWSIVCLSMDSIVIAVRSGTGVLYVSVWIILLQLSGLALEYCMSQYGFYCYHSCQVWHWSIVCLSMDSIVIIAVRSGTGVLYVSVWILFLQLSGLALENCMSQYGFYFYSCQVWHWSIVCLSMDYIVIAVRSGTGVLQLSQYGFYCYHSCQVWHWSIVCLSMDYIVIIALRSGTGVLYVSVWIRLLSQLSGLALEYCTSQYGFYFYHSCQIWHWSIVCLSMDYIVIIPARSGTGVLYVSVWILLLSQLSGLILEYGISQYGVYCYRSSQV